MKVEQYIATLAPSMRKDKILDDLAVARKELKDYTIPAYDTISVLFGKWKWQSEEMKTKATAFSRIMGGKGVVLTIQEALQTIDKNLDVVQDFIVKTFNEEIVTSALTYKKAAVLQYLDAVSFLTKYARKFANYLLVCETQHLPDADSTLADAFAPAEIAYIESKFVMFAQAMNALACSPKDVIKRINDAPDVVVQAANAAVVEQTLGNKKTDPMSLGFISGTWNPFYHIGKAIAAWQVDSYNSAKEELQLVQMRKLYLEKLQAKKPDAALAQEIQYVEGRVQNLNAKIAKMESDYA
jgi:hypothetical protein